MSGASAVRRGGSAAESWLAPLLLGALAGSLVAARFETGSFCFVLAAVLAARAGARLPGRTALALVGSGTLLSVGLNLYLVAGNPIAAVPALFGAPATWEGLVQGALLSLRALGAWTALLGLAAVWPGERGVDAIARGIRPLARLGLPVGEVRRIASLAWRFHPAVRSEAARIARLQALRAGRPPRGLGERLMRVRAVLVPVMTASLERAERVALALEARHAGDREPPPGARAAWPAAALGIAVAASSLAWRAA